MKAKSLTAKQIWIPEILEDHTLVLGRTGRGKTYGVKSGVETIVQASEQLVWLDPTDAAYGLRLETDGKTPHKDFAHVIVVGGPHGDVALPQGESGAQLLAEVVCRDHISVIVSMKGMKVGERVRWSATFAETLLQRIETPLHLVIDEAHRFAPQGSNPNPDASRMLHAFNEIAAGGRSCGIRMTAITQRPAKLHKDLATCCGTLVAFGVTAPQDRKAVKEWVDGNGDPATSAEVLNSLAGLPKGTAWVWCPEAGVLQLTKFPKIQTYDSSATPKFGQKVGKSVTLGEVDKAALDTLFKAAGERIKQDDPKELRREIAELKRAAREAVPVLNTAAIKAEMKAAQETAYNTGFEDGYRTSSKETTINAIQVFHVAYETARTELWKKRDEDLEISRIPKEKGGFTPPTAPAKPSVAHFAEGLPALPAGALAVKYGQSLADKEMTRDVLAAVNGPLTECARQILTVLAYVDDPIGQKDLATRAGYRITGTWRTTMATLRRDGLIYDDGDGVRITAAGREAVGPVDSLPVGEKLLNMWIAKTGKRGLSKCEREILNALRGGRECSQAELCERTGYAVTGTWRTCLARLRKLGLLEKGRRFKLTAKLL